MSPVVGVIGGGQLARMMVPAAIALGIEIRVLAEQPGMSAAIAATAVGDYRDLDTVLAFARDVDVVTFDHEHVPQQVLAGLVEAGVEVRPGPGALAVAQDKVLMREKLTSLGLPVPAWGTVSRKKELRAFLGDHGGRAVVKTPRGGYDGKGVKVVDDAGDVREWFTALDEDANGGVLLVEEFVDFRRELAQLVARRPSGEIAVWPLVETVQEGGVCSEVIAPAPGNVASAQAEAIARAVAEGLGVTGVLAVELFETQQGELLVNELAMRPHNSGHWTIDGAVTSQFEQHLRAVLDLPLGDTEPLRDWTVMANVLGGPESGWMTDRYADVLGTDGGVKVHAYGKPSRPGRKVGHVNAVGDDLDDVLERARAMRDLFR